MLLHPATILFYVKFFWGEAEKSTVRLEEQKGYDFRRARSV